MRIGPYQLSSPFTLAPMAGISDAPFRKLCRRFGAGMTNSEMTTADISLWKTAKSKRRLDIDSDAEPRAVQIAGADPDQMYRSLEKLNALPDQTILFPGHDYGGGPHRSLEETRQINPYLRIPDIETWRQVMGGA